jgi:hypothetical protein
VHNGATFVSGSKNRFATRVGCVAAMTAASLTFVKVVLA